MAERALRVPDVAAEYGVAPKTVYGWVRDGKMQARRLPGGDIRFRRADLDAFDERCRDRNSPAPTTDSSGEEPSGASGGPTPTPASLDPFRRGRETARRPKSGATNG